jgi:hypothetical protein
VGGDRLAIIFTRRFAIVGLAFVLIYSVIAGLQYLYVKTQLSLTSSATLTDWTNQVSQAIDYAGNNSWNLTEYQQADISAENYVVITADGTVVSTVGFVRGLITKVAIPASYKSGAPLDFTSSIGERWRLSVYDLQDGRVFLGISEFNPVPKPDDLLASTAHILGRSVQDALKVESRQIDINVDYAVIASDGTLKYAIGGIPLKVISSRIAANDHGATNQQSLDHKSYQVLSKPITDRAGHAVGTIIALRNIDAELQTLSHQLYFNAVVAAIAFLLTLLLFVFYALRTRLGEKEGFVPLTEALKRGEGQEVEFKEMLPHAGRPDGERDGVRRFATALAAFANSNPGNVFVGVDDRGEVRGLATESAKEKEKALEVIKNLILQHISPTITPEVGWVDHDGRTVMHLYVPRGHQPIYTVGGAIYIRHLASVQAARADQVESMMRKFYGRHRTFS